MYIFVYSSNKNSVNLIAIIIIIIFDLSIIIIAIPVIEAVTNNSIIGILGETITIQFTVIRAVPTVSIVLWNYTSGIVEGELFNSVLSSDNLDCNNNNKCSLSQDRLVSRIHKAISYYYYY